jgi:hypothetical protein
MLLCLLFASVLIFFTRKIKEARIAKYEEDHDEPFPNNINPFTKLNIVLLIVIWSLLFMYLIHAIANLVFSNFLILVIFLSIRFDKDDFDNFKQEYYYIEEILFRIVFPIKDFLIALGLAYLFYY